MPVVAVFRVPHIARSVRIYPVVSLCLCALSGTLFPTSTPATILDASGTGRRIMPAEVVVVPAGSVVASAPEPGLTRLVGAYNEKLFLAEHRMEAGWIGVAHSHPHDQMAYVVSGHLTVTAGGRTFEARAGDSFVIQGGVEHQATALEASVVIDVFTPCRSDYS
jgi:unsaturated pyranuronate lyase